MIVQQGSVSAVGFQVPECGDGLHLFSGSF